MTRGGGTSDQRRFVQGKHRLVRDERSVGGNFHQTGLENAGEGQAEHGSVGAGEMAAIVMMRWGVLIAVAVILGIAAVLGRMLGGAFVVGVMACFVNHARREPCEDAESEKDAGEKVHGCLINRIGEMAKGKIVRRRIL